MPRSRQLLVVLAFGFVTIKRVSAQTHALRQVGDLRRFHRSAWQFGEDSRVTRSVRQFAEGNSAQFEKIGGLEVRRLADTYHDKAGHLEAFGDREVKRRILFAGKTVRLRGPPHNSGSLAQSLSRGRAELQPSVAEHEKDTFCGSAKWRKAELQGVGHRGPLSADPKNHGPLWPGLGTTAKATTDRNLGNFSNSPVHWPRTGRLQVAFNSGRCPTGPTVHRLKGHTFTFCCACSTALPLPGHFVEGSKMGLTGVEF